MFGAGLVPGADAYQRMANLVAPTTELLASYASIVEALHDLLGSAAARARERFGGAVTYAAGAWEPVDWAPFDLVAVDAYRDVTNATTYRDEIRRLTGQPKPVAVTEFGCCTFHGAAALGARGWAILEGTGPERRVAGDVQRDEAEQARYLIDLLAIYEDEGVDAAFWYTFASFDKPCRRSSDEDLDLASFGVVAVEEPDEDGRYRTLTRKESFAALAAHQGRR